MEAVATTLAVPDARRGRRVQLGRAVFALTSAAFLVAVALDVDAGAYKTLPYLGLNVVIALIGLLLTTRRPQHRISWVLRRSVAPRRCRRGARSLAEGACGPGYPGE